MELTAPCSRLSQSRLRLICPALPLPRPLPTRLPQPHTLCRRVDDVESTLAQARCAGRLQPDYYLISIAILLPA